MIKTFTSDKFITRQLWIVLVLSILPLTSIYGVEINFNTMLASMKASAGPIISFTVATAYVIGIWFIISAIIELKYIGQSQTMMSQQHTMTGPLVKFVIGLLLLYLPSTIDVGVWTIWQHGGLGAENESLMAYAPAPNDPFGPAKEGSVAIVRVIGYVSFVRGLVMLSRAAGQGSQPGTFGKGFLYILGGIAAINIKETINIIGASVGFENIM